jgi:hypothetical protein
VVDPGLVKASVDLVVKGVGALTTVLHSNADCDSFYRLLETAAARAICRDKPEHEDVKRRANYLVDGIKSTAEAKILQPTPLRVRVLARAKKAARIKSRPDVDELTRDGLRRTLSNWARLALSRQALVKGEPEVLELPIGCKHDHGPQAVADRLGDAFLDVLYAAADSIGPDRKFARRACENIDKAEKALGGLTPKKVAVSGTIATGAAGVAAAAASAPTVTTIAILAGGVLATSAGTMAVELYRDNKRHGTPLGPTLQRAVQLRVLDMTLLLHSLQPGAVVEDLLATLVGPTPSRLGRYKPVHAEDLLELLKDDLLPRLTRQDADPQLVIALEGAGDVLRRIEPDRSLPFIDESCGQLREVLRLLDAPPLRLDEAA